MCFWRAVDLYCVFTCLKNDKAIHAVLKSFRGGLPKYIGVLAVFAGVVESVTSNAR